MLDAAVHCIECHREKGIFILDAGTDEGCPPSAEIILHCANCDQHFRLSMITREDHIQMGWEAFPCPQDPCPYVEAHKASHES
jgi:hypothetical protein